MAAPKGNKNAEKWTFEESEKLYRSVLEYVESNKDCCSLTEACTEIGYYDELLNYIKEKHGTIDFSPIKKASNIIKQRIIKKGLNNEYNPTMSIFILKNNHGMKEKVEQDIKIQKPLTINIDGKELDL